MNRIKLFELYESYLNNKLPSTYNPLISQQVAEQIRQVHQLDDLICKTLKHGRHAKKSLKLRALKIIF